MEEEVPKQNRKRSQSPNKHNSSKRPKLESHFEKCDNGPKIKSPNGEEIERLKVQEDDKKGPSDQIKEMMLDKKRKEIQPELEMGKEQSRDNESHKQMMTSSLSINSLPFEILRKIFKMLDTVTMVKTSQVCSFWKNVYKQVDEKDWKRICRSEINSSTLKQILSRLSSDEKTSISWKQLYISWFTSTHNSFKWSFKNQTEVPLNFFSSEIKIFRCNIIVYKKGSSQFSLYSLEDGTLLDSFKRDDIVVYFGVTEVNSTVYLFYLSYIKQILVFYKIEQNRFVFCRIFTNPLPIRKTICYFKAYDNYFSLTTTEMTRIYKLNHDSGNAKKKINLELLFEFESIEGVTYSVWNQKFIVTRNENINIYSMDDNFSEVGHLTVAHTLDYMHFKVFENSVLIYNNKHLYELYEDEEGFHCRKEPHKKASYRSRIQYGSFCNMSFVSQEEAPASIMIKSPSSFKNYFSSSVHSVCSETDTLDGYFKDDSLYIVCGAKERLFIRRYVNSSLLSSR